MKAVRISEGKEVIYVQNSDLLYLYNNEFPLSFSIRKIIGDSGLLHSENIQEDYTEFTRQKDVDFLNSVDIIINVDEYNKMTILEANKQFKNIYDEYNQKNIKYNMAYNPNAKQDNANQEYLLRSIKRVIDNKENDIPLILPETNNLNNKSFK